MSALVLISKSYFSSLFAASRMFPRYLGAASGASMTLFGLSPFFLSLLASRYFTDSSTGLNVTHFLIFLAVASGLVHLVGAFTLHLPKPQCDVSSLSESSTLGDEECSTDERQPLIRNKVSGSVMQAIPVDESRSVLCLFRDPYFWLLAFILLIILGSVSNWSATCLCIFD